MAKAEYKSAIRSRRMLQRALVELLQEKELDKITVTDIVTRADINRGTFYAHYADISGVLDSIMENVCQTIREALEKQPLWAKAPDARIVLQHLQRMLESDPEFYRNAIRTNVSNIVLEKLREFFIEQMMQRESGYAVRNHEQYVFTVRFGSGGVITLYKDWFSGNLPFSLDECCFSKRMRKLFRKNEKSVLQFCNKSSKTKRAFTKVLMPCKRPF